MAIEAHAPPGEKSVHAAAAAIPTEPRSDICLLCSGLVPASHSPSIGAYLTISSVSRGHKDGFNGSGRIELGVPRHSCLHCCARGVEEIERNP
jgi:hypothetical protein